VGPVRAVAILGVLAFSSGVSAQQSADEQAARRLDEAERQYRELDFEGTVATARAALTISGVGDAVRLRAYEILGAAFVVLEREAEATEAFREMLAIDPYHRVHEATGSPKIENFVEALRTRLVPDAALDLQTRVQAEVPERARAGEEIAVGARIDGPGAVERVQLRFRDETSSTWASLTLDPSPDALRFEGTLPPPDAEGRVVLYVEARDGRDRLVARAGAPLAPLAIAIDPARVVLPPPTTSRLWIAGVAGGAVAVVLAVVLAVTLSGGEQAPSGTLPPGRVELP